MHEKKKTHLEFSQDAWLDSIDVAPKAAEKTRVITTNEDEAHDLTSEELGKIKRRIADVLEPGETVNILLTCFLLFAWDISIIIMLPIPLSLYQKSSPYQWLEFVMLL